MLVLSNVFANNIVVKFISSANSGLFLSFGRVGRVADFISEDRPMAVLNMHVIFLMHSSFSVNNVTNSVYDVESAFGY